MNFLNSLLFHKKYEIERSSAIAPGIASTSPSGKLSEFQQRTRITVCEKLWIIPMRDEYRIFLLSPLYAALIKKSHQGHERKNKDVAICLGKPGLFSVFKLRIAKYSMAKYIRIIRKAIIIFPLDNQMY